MRAIVIHAHGGIERLSHDEVTTPAPGPGEVLVRIKAAGLNHFDHDIREGVSGVRQALPHVLGCEGVGEVAALGPGVTGFAPGQRVAVNSYQVCGQCRMCLSGLDGICEQGFILGVQAWGTFAEYVVSNERSLLPLPEALSFIDGAASIVTFGTAWHMAVTLGAVQAGEWVLVNAAGSGVGSAAVQIARLHGARVIASAGSDTKLERARALGAEATINYATHDIDRETAQITGRQGVDLVIESVGGAVLQQSLAALRKAGRLITCGAHAGERVEIDVITLFRKHIRLQGSHYASRREVAHVLGLIGRGELKPLIHGVYPFAEVQTAARHAANRDFFGKMVLTPE
ncbi:MAG: zinc-binding dehydrogenase [Alphaproteobacteria bacterium]|nr:zinc-binding dehydrogenase [Alphaproteobacteria bacterium]